MRILVLEPYFGGSHKAFLEGLARHLPFEFEFLSLPARKWKWRMRFSAPYFAEKLKSIQPPDRILCSTFVDVATLKGLAPAWVREIPVLTYFHENQFAYPVQVKDERDFHFGLTNFTTALASERLAFNTRYNLDSFLTGCRQISKKIPDMPKGQWLDAETSIRAKSTVLPPGHDFAEIDRRVIRSHHCVVRSEQSAIPRIVWNHRWEHDKNPELFFKTLYELEAQGIEFGLIVLGQSFQRQPQIFAQARKILADRIVHFGYAESRLDYIRLLRQGDIVVSTANHEFYGIAVLEAVRAGCYPLLPNRLAYPELFGSEYLYDDRDLTDRLMVSLTAQKRLSDSQAVALTNRFSWQHLAQGFQDWLT